MTLGVYIQVPFCQTKCTYCNFHTGVVSRDRYEPYARAVCREISEAASSVGPIVDPAYFGGGPPSLLEPSALASILDTLRSMHRTESLEATLEADPEKITPPKASEWLAGGFHRVSPGGQFFDDGEIRP